MRRTPGRVGKGGDCAPCFPRTQVRKGSLLPDALFPLNDINVVLGQLVLRGTQVGTIGTNRGMYPAHLHVELHYNPDVNCGHQGIPKTERNYGRLTDFITRFRRLPLEKRMVRVPIGGFLPYKGTEGL